MTRRFDAFVYTGALALTRGCHFHRDSNCRALGNRAVTERDLYRSDDGTYWVSISDSDNPPSVDHIGRYWQLLIPCGYCQHSPIERVLGDSQAWRENAACRNSNDSGFFNVFADGNAHKTEPILTEAARRALALCAICPARLPCRDFWRELQRLEGPQPCIGGGETYHDRERWLGTHRKP